MARIEASDPDLAHLVLMAALTGCRRGELCALRWSDVDLDSGVLHVRRRLVDADGRVSEQEGTKAGKPRRILLDELAVATLRRLHGLQSARAVEAGVELAEGGYLLSREGLGVDRRRPDEVSKAVREHARAVGLRGVHLHTLRHYAATELIGAGVDVRTVATRLGHSDPALTLRVYSHQLDARDLEAAQLLGRALAPPS